MCGITGCFGIKNAPKYLLDSLKRLEYRGYDSAGIATLNDSQINIKKDTGEIDEIDQKHQLTDLEGNIGMGQTRWATHGDVTKENAHPHLSCDERFVIVHNGIIENWKELRGELSDHEFTSETDSEIIAHFIEENAGELGVEEAVKKFLKKAEGSFAVVLLDAEEEKMYAFKRGSPLALGVGNEETYLGSDLYAFSTHTNEAIFFQDDEYAIIEGGNYTFKNSEGKVLDKKPQEFDWEQEPSEKGEYDHFMRKEVGEIPTSIRRLERSIENNQNEELEKLVKEIQNHERVLFTASGTSYHASLLGVFFLHRVGIDAQTLIASEFSNYERVDENTLVIPISQSGETKDVLEAIEFSRERGAKIASIVNVPHSSIEREADVSLRVRAGQEICVAATKTFANQLYLLLKLAERLGYETHTENLPEEIEGVIKKNEPRIKELGKELAKKNDIYLIGRGITYPVAREMALKMKEIAYIHAEGMMGGELKHGTLALIEEGTPVISLIPEKSSEIKSNVKEVEARGAKSIKISPFEGSFKIPHSNSRFAFYTTVLGFLLAYWTAREKDLPIDKPRNLAKSVTVK